MSRLVQIETFVTVVERGSLAAAARELDVSAAAVSKQITKLEEDLGIQLLLRSTRKLELTDLGEAYLEQCRRILEEVDAANALVSHMKQVPKGSLKVFSQTHFTAKYITPNLKEFLALYPGVEIQLELEERVPNFEAEGVDIMIGASMPADAMAVQRRVTTTRYCICASPDYLKDAGVPEVPEDLKKHQCIAHSQRPRPCFYGHRKADIDFVPFMSVNNAGCLAELALQGLGIVQLHHYVVKDAIGEGRLVELFEDYSRRDVAIYYALPQRRYTPSKVRCFIDFILAKVGESPL